MTIRLSVNKVRTEDRLGPMAGCFEVPYQAPHGEFLLLMELEIENVSDSDLSLPSLARSLVLSGTQLSARGPHPESVRLVGHKRIRPPGAAPDLGLLRPRASRGTTEHRPQALYELETLDLAPGEILSGSVAFQLPVTATGGLQLKLQETTVDVYIGDTGPVQGSSAPPLEEESTPYRLPAHEMVELSVPKPWLVIEEGNTLGIELELHIRSRFAVRTYRIPEVASSIFLDVALDAPPPHRMVYPFRLALAPDPESANFKSRTVIRREPKPLPGLVPGQFMDEGRPYTEALPLWGKVDIEPGETMVGRLLFRIPRLRIRQAAIHLPDAKYGLARAALHWKDSLEPRDYYPREHRLPKRVEGPRRPARGLQVKADSRDIRRSSAPPEKDAARPEWDQLPVGKEYLIIPVTISNHTIGLARFRPGESVRLVADGGYQVPPVTPGAPGPEWILSYSDELVLLPLEEARVEFAFVVPAGFDGRIELLFMPPGMRQLSVVQEGNQSPGEPEPSGEVTAAESTNAYTRARVVGVRRAASSDGRPVRVVEAAIHLFHDAEANLSIFRDRMRLQNVVSGTIYQPDPAATLEQAWPLFGPDELPGHAGESRRRFQVAFPVPEEEGDLWRFEYADVGGPISLSVSPGRPQPLLPDAPNTHRDAAEPLITGVPREGRFPVEPRSFWFQLRDDADQSRVYYIALELPEAQGRLFPESELPDLAFYIHTAEAVVSLPVRRQPHPDRVWHGALLTGVVLHRGVDYYLEVYGADRAGAGHCFVLTTGVLGMDDGRLEVERFTNSPAAAQALTHDRPIRGWGQVFGEGDDLDWFRFQVPGPGRTRTRLSFRGQGEMALFREQDILDNREPLLTSQSGAARHLLWPDLPLEPGAYLVRLKPEPSWLEEPFDLCLELDGPWPDFMAPPWALTPERAMPLREGKLAHAFLYEAKGTLLGPGKKTTGLEPIWNPYHPDKQPERRFDNDIMVRWFALDIPDPEPVLLSAAMTPVPALFNAPSAGFPGVATNRTNHMVALVDEEGQVLAESGWRMCDFQGLAGRQFRPQESTIFLHYQPLPPGRYFLEVKARDPDGRAVPEQALTLNWAALPVQVPVRPLVPTLPQDLGLEVNLRFLEAGDEAHELVHVDPGGEVRLEFDVRSGELSLYPRNIAVFVNQRGAMKSHEDAVRQGVQLLGRHLFANDQLAVMGVLGGCHDLLVPWSAPSASNLEQIAEKLRFISRSGDFLALSFSLSEFFDSIEELFEGAGSGPSLAVLITTSHPPAYGAYDPRQLALHFRRVQVLTGVALRIIFVDKRLLEEESPPSPWPELIEMASSAPDQRIWTVLTEDTTLEDLLAQVGTELPIQVAADLELLVDLPPGADIVPDTDAEHPPETAMENGSPTQLRWALPDLTITRRGKLVHQRAVVLRNRHDKPWVLGNGRTTTLRYTDPFFQRRVQRFGPGLTSVPSQSLLRPPGPGGDGGGEVKVPAAHGILSVALRGEAPPPARTLIVVLDTSGSMKTETTVEVNGVRLTRLQVAQRALKALLDDQRVLPDGSRLAVLVFADEAARELWPLQEVDRRELDELRSRIDALLPQGGTPIHPSLEHVHALLASGETPGPIAVLLITDGKPSGEPSRSVDSAGALYREHAGTRLHVLGVDQAEEEGVRIGKQIAAAGGGSYFYVAAQVETLLLHLRAAVQPVYEVLDAKGNWWGSGVLTDEPEHRVRDFELPVGTWFVRVHGLEDPVRILVREGRITTLVIKVVDGQLVVDPP